MGTGKDNSVEATLREYRSRINHQMGQFFSSATATLDLDLSPQSVKALGRLADFSLRPGMRLRGSLGAWAYDQANKSSFAQMGLELGVALELIQNYFLIVDDVMDRSDFRRGKPSLHKLFAKEHQLKGDEHIADMLAINVGALAHHLASLIVARLDEAPDRVDKALQLFGRSVAATVFGQIDDLYQNDRRQVSEVDIIRAYYLKSSTYTFINPLQMGAVLGGNPSSKTLAQIDEFGAAAGIAFQLKDDMLGVYGEPAQTGKPNLDDIKEGKITLLMHYGLKQASPQEVKVLKLHLGNPKFNQADLARVRRILQDCGAKESVQKRIESYAKQAKALTSKSDFWTPPAKQFLNELIDFVTERQK